MDRSNVGRCHPNNIWALNGLLACLRSKVASGEGTSEIEAEIREIENKIRGIIQVKKCAPSLDPQTHHNPNCRHTKDAYPWEASGEAHHVKVGDFGVACMCVKKGA